MNTNKKSSIVVKAREISPSAVTYLTEGLNSGELFSIKSIGNGDVKITITAQEMEARRLIRRAEFAIGRVKNSSWMSAGGLSMPDLERVKVMHGLTKEKKKVAKKKVANNKMDNKNLAELFSILLFFMEESKPLTVSMPSGSKFLGWNLMGDFVLTTSELEPIMYKVGGEGEYIYL